MAIRRAEYDLWANYYDIIHTGLPGETEFYVGQAVKLNTCTLELGCGTGRICIPIAMSGTDVLGLDISEAMLWMCREKKEAIGNTSGKFSVIQADMRRFELLKTFDLIIMPYRAFMHLITPDERRSCLECVFRHLNPGGTFIVSLWAGRPAEALKRITGGGRTMAFAGRYLLPDDAGHLVHYVSSWCEDDRQIISEEHVIHEVSNEGEALRTTLLPMRRAWLTPEQMKGLLEEQGFRIVALFGDFDCAPFSDESSEMIWVTERKGG